MSEVIVHRHAARYLQRLPQERKERVKTILRQLAQNPLGYPNVRHMVGDWGWIP
jgi:mRNA-degrading endonuclease RelE of RelBE toxin-antitoxin system